MRPVIAGTGARAKEVAGDLFATRTGGNGERIFEVFDGATTVFMAYDISGGYGAATFFEGQSNIPVVVTNRNRKVEPPFTFDINNPSIAASAVNFFRNYNERYDNVNQNEACWVMIRGLW